MKNNRGISFIIKQLANFKVYLNRISQKGIGNANLFKIKTVNPSYSYR